MEIQNDIFDSASGKILRYLLGHGEVTVKDIEDGIAVTRNAVRIQIDHLVAQGFVGSRLVRTERGRPNRVYFVTDKGRDSLPNHYKDLARSLWQEIYKISDPEKKKQLLNILSTKLAEEYSSKVAGSSAEERMSRFVKVLNEQGIPAEMNKENGEFSWQEFNCPYYEVAKENQDVCKMELEMMQKIIGSPIERREWILAGDTGCQFKLAKSSK